MNRLASIVERLGQHPTATQVVVAVLTLWLLTWIVGKVTASRHVKYATRGKTVGARTLVVAVHGWLGAGRMRQMLAVIEREIPDAEILVPRYNSMLLSNKSPFEVASELEEEIDRRYELYKYEKIVLVGFSMGSLLVRKAFTWGHGGANAGDRPEGATSQRAWVQRVERVVLLAGLNRGWSLAAREQRTEVSRSPGLVVRLLGRLSVLLARMTGTCRQMAAFERGSPFVADLRVQWVRLARTCEREGRHFPSVIQILGTGDGIVSIDDNKDIVASVGFVYIPVGATSHYNIIDLDATGEARPESPQAKRAAAFSVALSGSEDDLRRYERNERSTLRVGDPAENISPTPVSDVVFVMHGIRDSGAWTEEVERALRELGGARVEVIRSSYGFFPMGAFLLLGARQQNVRWFMDRYTEAVARYPVGTRISFMGHSNGTYLLASAMRRYKSLVVHNVLFAGSVVHRTYDWSRLLEEGRIAAIRNVTASRDWVVAIFPRLFELITEWFNVGADGRFDLGAAGFHGFSDLRLNVNFAAGNHGAVITFPRVQGARMLTQSASVKLEAIAAFLVDGRVQALDVLKETSSVGPGVDWLSRVCYLVWAGIVVTLILVGIAIGHFVPGSVASIVALLVYAALILALLHSI